LVYSVGSVTKLRNKIPLARLFTFEAFMLYLYLVKKSNNSKYGFIIVVLNIKTWTGLGISTKVVAIYKLNVYF
jgi:hypothetical protein